MGEQKLTWICKSSQIQRIKSKLVRNYLALLIVLMKYFFDSFVNLEVVVIVLKC